MIHTGVLQRGAQLAPARRSRHLRLRLAANLADAGTLARTALPITVMGLLNITISATDTAMIAAYDARDLATVVVISDFYSIIFYFAAGIASAVTPLAANAIGAGRTGEVGRILVHAAAILVPMAAIGALTIAGSVDLARWLGIGLESSAESRAYAGYMAAAFAVMLPFALARGLLTALVQSGAAMAVLACAVPLNALGNYVLIHGAFGFPELGVAGAGAASLLVAIFCAVSVWTYLLKMPVSGELARAGLRLEPALLRRVFRTGLMIAVATIAETGVFLCATLVMGMVAAASLPAHAIVFRAAGLSYCMVAGFAQAIMVQTALAHGSAQFRRQLRIGRTAQMLSLVIAAFLFCAFAVAANLISPALADTEGASLAKEVRLLMPLAGLSIALLAPGSVAGAILRGQTMVTAPALLAVTGYWVVGFGTMAALLAAGTLDAAGIWISLAAGSAAASIGSCSYLALRTGSVGASPAGLAPRRA